MLLSTVHIMQFISLLFSNAFLALVQLWVLFCRFPTKKLFWMKESPRSGERTKNWRSDTRLVSLWFNCSCHNKLINPTGDTKRHSNGSKEMCGWARRELWPVVPTQARWWLSQGGEGECMPNKAWIVAHVLFQQGVKDVVSAWRQSGRGKRLQRTMALQEEKRLHAIRSYRVCILLGYVPWFIWHLTFIASSPRTDNHHQWLTVAHHPRRWGAAYYGGSAMHWLHSPCPTHHRHSRSQSTIRLFRLRGFLSADPGGRIHFGLGITAAASLRGNRFTKIVAFMSFIIL